jgi:hypothetical protein
VWDCDGNFVVVILIGGMINKCWGWIGDLLGREVGFDMIMVLVSNGCLY